MSGNVCSLHTHSLTFASFGGNAFSRTNQAYLECLPLYTWRVWDNNERHWLYVAMIESSHHFLPQGHCSRKTLLLSTCTMHLSVVLGWRLSVCVDIFCLLVVDTEEWLDMNQRFVDYEKAFDPIRTDPIRSDHTREHFVAVYMQYEIHVCMCGHVCVGLNVLLWISREHLTWSHKSCSRSVLLNMEQKSGLENQTGSSRSSTAGVRIKAKKMWEERDYRETIVTVVDMHRALDYVGM